MIHINIPTKYQKHYEYLKIIVNNKQFILDMLTLVLLLAWLYVVYLTIYFMKETIKMY